MADDIDRAQELDALELSDALARQALANRNDNLTALTCIDCDDEIPAARRKAAPGCKRCVACQADFERLARHEREEL